MDLRCSSILALVGFCICLCAGSAAANLRVEWVTVGNPGNAADSTGLGAVSDLYLIGKYEVTNAQYAGFLNSVARTDTHALFNPNMATGTGGIVRAGASGSYSYSVIEGRESMPVVIVSFWDALRFANWLHNGQPVGLQSAATTEDGAYTLSPAAIANDTVTRNAGAVVFLPSNDEWYKAAYYDGAGSRYYQNPAGQDATPTCALTGSTANSANCDQIIGDVTSAGGYTGSSSPSGTLDQGGNVWEWTEESNDLGRVIRGGSYFAVVSWLGSSSSLAFAPTAEYADAGFRVASRVPRQCSAGPSEGDSCRSDSDCAGICDGGMFVGEACTIGGGCEGLCDFTGTPCLSDGECPEIVEAYCDYSGQDCSATGYCEDADFGFCDLSGDPCTGDGDCYEFEPEEFGFCFFEPDFCTVYATDFCADSGACGQVAECVPVPEPGSALLAGTALAVLAGLARSRREPAPTCAAARRSLRGPSPGA